jgi:predicted nuclease of restriction endonuclease-like (RecB) superfamily
MSEITHSTELDLLSDINRLIIDAKVEAYKSINSTLILRNYRIGDRINQEILKGDRAAYGKNILDTLADELRNKYGSGFDKTSLSRMVKFSRYFNNIEIVASLSQQLSWSHIIQIIAIEDELKREFYLKMAQIEKWGVRDLRKKISGMLFERAAISKKPRDLIKKEITSIETSNTISKEILFQDPYLFTFLGQKDVYSESDLETAILDELTNFLYEFGGSDFCFCARQKRMSSENRDRYLDLLFFHRGMRRLVAIELKLGSFEPSYKGQMEWYLNWLDKHERKDFEEKPIGIILCANKEQSDIEYLELDQNGIHVGEYITKLPTKDLLKEKINNTINSIQNIKLYSDEKCVIKNEVADER